MITKPFYPLKKKKIVGFNMSTLLSTRPVKGDIGIEIEVEGNKFQKTQIPAPWSYHKDGSLRGEDNAEYVLKAPIAFEKVPEAIEILWQMFANYGSVLDESNRTSVHVHLNAQKFHMNRLAAFLALYFSVEELLTAWCGDHRIGNLFCLRAKDATAIVSSLKKFIQSDGKYEIREGMHYAGLNAQALYKFGSIEIRTLRGVNDPKTILDWVSILERIYKLSADFSDPREIPGLLSSEGPMNYLDLVLGDKASTVKNGIDYSIDRIRDALYDGIRLAQDLCYCRDWSLYTPTDAKDDPFGRDLKKVAQALTAMTAQEMQQAINQQHTITLGGNTYSQSQPLDQWYVQHPEPGYILTPGPAATGMTHGQYLELMQTGVQPPAPPPSLYPEIEPAEDFPSFADEYAEED